MDIIKLMKAQGGTPTGAHAVFKINEHEVPEVTNISTKSDTTYTTLSITRAHTQSNRFMRISDF